MARKKVQLRYIEDAAARKASFRKRRQGLLKKVEELSILCDVVACVIVYGEDPTELPVHWPGNRADVEQALWKHQASPDMQRWKRTVTREGYVEERIEKYTEQLKKLGRSIHEMEMYHLMQLVYLDGKSNVEFTMNELKSLCAFAGERVKELERRGRFLLEIGNAPLASSVSDNFRGFPGNVKQGNPSVATNGLPKEEVIHSHPLNGEGSDGGGISTTGLYRFPGDKFQFGDNRRNKQPRSSGSSP